MSIINYQAEQREIANYLTNIGIAETDHRYILDRLKTDPAAHLRYLETARTAKPKN